MGFWNERLRQEATKLEAIRQQEAILADASVARLALSVGKENAAFRELRIRIRELLIILQGTPFFNYEGTVSEEGWQDLSGEVNKSGELFHRARELTLTLEKHVPTHVEQVAIPYMVSEPIQDGLWGGVTYHRLESRTVLAHNEIDRQIAINVRSLLKPEGMISIYGFDDIYGFAQDAPNHEKLKMLGYYDNGAAYVTYYRDDLKHYYYDSDHPGSLRFHLSRDFGRGGPPADSFSLSDNVRFFLEALTDIVAKPLLLGTPLIPTGRS